MYAPASSGASVPGVPGPGTATSPIGPFSPYGQPVSSPLFDFTPSRSYGGLPRSTGPWNEPGGYYGGNPYQTPPDDAAYRYDPRMSIYGLVPVDFTREDITNGDYSGSSGGNRPGGGGSLPDDGNSSSWWFWQDALRGGLIDRGDDGGYAPDANDAPTGNPKYGTDAYQDYLGKEGYAQDAYQKYRDMGGTMSPAKFFAYIYPRYGDKSQYWLGPDGGSGGTSPSPDDPGPYDKYGYKDPNPRDTIKSTGAMGTGVTEPTTTTAPAVNAPSFGGLAPAPPKYGNWENYQRNGYEGAYPWIQRWYDQLGEQGMLDHLAKGYKETWGVYPEGYTP